MIDLQPVDQAVCPDENALSELVQGLLDAPTASSIEAHLDGCAECRRIVSAVGQSSYVAQRLTAEDKPRNVTWAMLEPSDTPTWAQAPAAKTIPPLGTVLAGKYRIERLLGQGGMGVVMAAKHLTLGKLVAIKLMRAELLIDTGAAQRFVREARAASRLRSEHIVRVIDLDTLEDGAPYIAMEYLEGEDLGALLARSGPMSATDAAVCIAQVCEAVAEAHAAGIVHRDLKPANLFVTRRQDGSPCMKVLDFGVSKIIAGGPLADDLTTTDTRALVGSPHYMAPEQLISAKAVDPRTDVWALGCILFELVSGRTPFTASALAEILASILRDEPPALDQVRTDLPAGFAALVATCLEKDPARRFQKVDHLAAAIAVFVAGQSSARGQLPAVIPAPAPQVTRRSLGRWIAAGVIGGALALGIWHLADTDDSIESPRVTQPATQAMAPVPMALDAGAHIDTQAPLDASVPDAPADAKPPRDRGTSSGRLVDDLLEPRF